MKKISMKKGKRTMEVTFESLGLSQAMLKALEEKGYGYPTTIQAEAIPYFLQWRDVIAKAKANNVPNDNINRMLQKASGADTADYFSMGNYLPE